MAFIPGTAGDVVGNDTQLGDFPAAVAVVDGGGAAKVLVATLHNKPALGAADIVVI